MRIDLLNGVKVVSKELFFDEGDMKSEALRFLIAFLACNMGKYFPAEYLNTKYEGEKDVSWADLIYKFRMKWKNARKPKYNKVKYYTQGRYVPITGTVVTGRHELKVPNKLQKRVYE